MRVSATRVRLKGSARSYWVALLLALAVGNAASQEALRNALTLDTLLTQRQNPEIELKPEQPHLGPVQLAYGLYAGTEWNDNINASQADPQADILLRGGVNFNLLWPATELSGLQLGAGLGYVHYLRNTRNGGLEVSPNSALTWQIGFDDGYVTFYDQFSYLQQVTQEATLVNVATLPRLENTIGARLTWEPSRLEIESGYGHNDYLSTDTAYEYLDRSSEYLFGRGGWRFAEKTQAGLEASTTLTSYRLTTQSDSQSLSAGVYADWQITQNLHATVRGGPAIYWFTSGRGDTPSLYSYYAELSVNQSLTRFLSHQLSFHRDVSLGLNVGSDYVEQFTANYSLSLALTEHINFGANFAYEQGDQPLLVPFPLFPAILILEKENYDRVGLGASISWAFTDHFTANLGYGLWERHSSLPARGYVQNSVAFQLSYRF